VIHPFASIRKKIMAVWQFDVELLPTELVGSSTRMDRTILDIEHHPAWTTRGDAADVIKVIERRLAGLLARSKSWSPEQTAWGEEPGDTLSVWASDGLIDSVFARIDCRNPNFPFLVALLDVANRLGCRLVCHRYFDVLPTTPSDLARWIQSSPSCEVLQNPAEVLPRLAREVEEAEEKANQALHETGDRHGRPLRGPKGGGASS
jgi:hypothetical protein